LDEQASVSTINQPLETGINEDQISDNDLTSDEIKTAVPKELSPETQRIEMEIKTSTLPELAQWCRILGLSESGTRSELSRRIRQYFKIPEPGIHTNTDRKVINVESAQTSEYFKIEVTGEEYARLKGDVRLSLTDNDSIHKIKAGEILFNRTRNILTANGNVVYEKETGNIIEKFMGESITVNIDDWSSIFLDGDSERILDSDGTAYLFSGSVMAHTSEDVTILNNARITNAKNEEALWSINASKLWLLPGSDFAFVNAVLRVGEIPLLYIPAFYFPADEMIFHPVVGYKSREGGFIQTTTYLLGRPKADASEMSSITKILGDTNDTEKERQGIFLRSTGKKILNPDELSLKALFDHYVNLGSFFGLNLYVPKTGILNPLDFSIGIGITRTLTLTGFGYTPYAPDYDGSSDWNKSNLFSFSVPFRYRMQMQSSIHTQFSDLSWSLPYYSDPYVNRDFMIRSENINLLSMMQEKIVSESDAEMENEIETYLWHISGIYNPAVTGFDPYISRISISNFSTSLTFKKIMDNGVLLKNNEAPGRFFYAPDNYTIYNFTGIVSGTPFTTGGINKNSPAGKISETDEFLKGIGSPVPPWNEENTVNSVKDEISDDKLIPPVLSQHFEIPASGNIKFDIGYQFLPTGASEVQFMNGNWKTYDQVDWSEVRTVLTSFGGNSFINFRFNESQGLFSNEFTFSGSGIWRDYTYLNEEADIFLDNFGNTDQSKVDNMRMLVYSQTNYSTSYAYSGILRPLFQNSIFNQSNIQYSFKGTLARSGKYSGGDGPELSPQWGAWVKEETKGDEPILGLSIHRFSTNFAVDMIDKIQKVSVSIDLPPLDTQFSANTIIRFWISETKTDFRIRKQSEIPDKEPQRWIYEPVYFSETLKFGKESSLDYYMVITPEENNEITTITSTLSLWNFRTFFKAIKSSKYKFEPYSSSNTSGGGNWVQYDEPALNPNELSFFYKQSFLNFDIIKTRIDFSLDINSSLSFNLQQNTNSNFQFQLGFRLGIAGFMDFSISAISENIVIWRYFKRIPGMGRLTSMYIEGPQNNIFVDFIDSFNFFNDSKRQRSGFKMKKFNLNAIHYLGDWTAELGISLYPYLDNASTIPKYKAVSDISFVVQWKPIKEIKTNMEYKGETGRWIKN
jgi:hypothetical protein